jgi:predicted nuclease with TOPRIM domain
LQEELTKEHAMTVRLQSNDLSIEHFEKHRKMIDTLKTEIIQLKDELRTHQGQSQSMKEQMNRTNIENNQLTLKVKQWKDALEQRQQWIDRVRQEVDRNASEGISHRSRNLLHTF